ncbi:MAG: IS481 family transposase [Solirubrobacterales bacterium]
MSLEGSWRLGPGARRRMVEAVKGGMSQKRAAARFCVSPATVNRWVKREREASQEQRRAGTWADDRSSRPRHSPAMLSEQEHDRICEVREHTGWGPRLIAPLIGRPHSTVHAALRRRGCSRRPRAPREAVVRYEWPCPGNLLHVDVKKFGRFLEPGHAVTGDRRRRSRRVGWDYVHSIVDDCSRLAYSEVHDDERAETVTGFCRRALDWLLGHGIVAERILSDNAWAYTHNSSLRRLLGERAIAHKTIRPYRPQTNGKVERYQQTMAREWAYGQTYADSDARRLALSHWLEHYNTCRNHSAIGDQPPIKRVHQVLGQDT